MYIHIHIYDALLINFYIIAYKVDLKERIYYHKSEKLR